LIRIFGLIIASNHELQHLKALSYAKGHMDGADQSFAIFGLQAPGTFKTADKRRADIIASQMCDNPPPAPLRKQD